MIFQSFKKINFRKVLFVAFCELFCSVDTSVDHFYIGKNQLQINCFNISCRIDLTVDMNDINIFKAAYNVNDSVNFTDISQKLVAQAFAFGSTFYKTCNIDKFQSCRSKLVGIVHFCKLVQSFIRH